MDAALHAGHRDIADISDDETSGVADGRRSREVGNLRVGDFCCAGEIVGEIAEAGAQNQSDARAQLGFTEDEFGRAFGAQELHAGFRFWLRCGHAFLCAHEKIPPIAADTRFAMVPASMARMPNLASWLRCSGARAPIPPI